ncbi:MAG: chromate transporter [Intestinimonas sp.]|jgi:chromate transporter|nr:chromate transporter [Intestinimonas sp.]
MILARLFFEFFKVGLFSVGGGLATIPFLQHIGTSTGWFTVADLANMIAVSESTPGPMGVNMASYVGFTIAGPVGCIIATLGLITPSVFIILIIAQFLQKFRHSWGVESVFYGLRPASTALITAALVTVAQLALFSPLSWKSIILAVAVFVCLRIKPLKKFHPAVFIGLSAIIGIVFSF